MTPEQAVKIRHAMRKRLGQVAMQLALVKEDEDERFPEEHRRTRRQQRSELIRQWAMIESQKQAELFQWQQEQAREVERLRAAQPIGDAATESRRVAENLEIAGLAEPLIGAGRTQINNRLLSEAKRFLSLDLPDRARVYLEAAKRAGVEDSALSNALDDAYDRTVPARRQAKAIEQVVRDQADLFDLDRYSMRIAHKVGNQFQADTTAKLIASRRGERTPAGMLDGAWAEGQLNRAAHEAGSAE